MAEAHDNDDVLRLLDSYLAELQAGKRPDRDAVLREHPELASALRCIDALENLAPPVEENRATLSTSSQDTAAKVGELPRDFGPYELIREIGRGGMGVVYEARQKGLDRSVAVKMILAGHLASPESVRRFQAEAKAAARLRHSNIVHIHDVGQLHGQDFFAMEFIDGQSLAERIKQGPIDAHAAAWLVATVARAVEHLHRQGIIHRDLKPSNILLDDEGQPFVTDFGLAKVFNAGSDVTATGVIAGTPSYMSPEQASSRRAEICPGTDVYSLGAILYELLTGVPPFQAETPLDTLMEVLSGDPAMPRTINPRIPRALELICLKCLAKEPKDRYASAEALADELGRFERGEALEARPPTVAQRFWSWTRRKPALALRLVGLSVFYVYDSWYFYPNSIDSQFTGPISLVVGLWLVTSLVCQRMLESRRWELPACYFWGTLDSLALFALLMFGNGAASSLVICYPLLIVASALWFRVRFVFFITVLSLFSYGVLVIDFYCWRPLKLQAVMQTNSDRHVVFALALVILGLIVAYLVQRVRILSSFFGKPM